MRILKRLFKWLLTLSLIGVFTGFATFAGVYYYFSPELPDVQSLREVKFQTPLRVYSADDKLIAEFGEKKRSPIPYEKIPDNFIKALQAAEDARFFDHFGIDIKGLSRAAFQLASTGRIQSGGSTITMQVAKNFFLTREQTFKRKFIEILLALQIEQELNKQEIMELYVNQIYLGHRAYGIQAAANTYYGQNIEDLSLAQLAMIAGLPKAPSAFNPITNPQRALERRDWILGRMLQLGYISQHQHEEAVSTPVTARYHRSDIELDAPYIAEMVRQQLYEQYGEDLYTDGYRVWTTVNSGMQKEATAALRRGLLDYTDDHGYRGAEANIDIDSLNPEDQLNALRQYTAYAGLEPALVLEVTDSGARLLRTDGSESPLDWAGIQWARPYQTVHWTGPAPKRPVDVLNAGDIIRVMLDDNGELRLTQMPQVQGALIALNPQDGAIRALTGGFSFYHNKFNRVTQAYRQPGSNIKPFLYTAALENGFTPASIINDAPVVFHDVSLEGTWRPENDNGKFNGPTRLREALFRSRNLVSIRLMRALGIEQARDFILRFGFEPENFPGNLSLSLGSASATPLQVARGYAALANGGFLVQPYLISRIENAEGEILLQANPIQACPDCAPTSTSENTSPALTGDDTSPSDSDNLVATEAPILLPPEQIPASPTPAPRIISPRNAFLIYDVMRDVITRGTGTRAQVLQRADLAGKTGTTNEQKDVWFSGFSPDLVATTWVGFDQPSPLGRGEYGSSRALPIWIDFMEEALQGIPDNPPAVPEGVVRISIDPATGKRAYPGQENAMPEYFRSEDVPRETARSPEQQLKAPATEAIFGF
ncbi:penicillin-binding protein 1A [Marinobacterium sediminicola]|uniref:Penicillin-binding protein 1A n=1 Tax=Marinobacterium sediminicola TaxID=518898 RepID=A0ABY1S1Y7_9GAMM|nr:penicillin-binding protein 1A [Marinobacterium sediminicola]ULG69521.1 penicillin-binding protein 1A [Marinobacterium sediminicola]SMR75673.1 penicillin-binding protein 1A [Marinobacterium sediminicola]